MAAGLHALGNHGIRSGTLHHFCHGHAGHHGNHSHPGSFPSGHVLARIPRAGGHCFHALLGHHPGDGVRLRVHQHDVHAEGLIRHGPALPYLLPDELRWSRPRADDAKAARLGHRGGQTALRYPCHAPLDQGIFRSQKFRYPSLHSRPHILTVSFQYPLGISRPHITRLSLIPLGRLPHFSRRRPTPMPESASRDSESLFHDSPNIRAAGHPYISIPLAAR